MKTLHVKTNGNMYRIGKRSIRGPFKIPISDEQLREFMLQVKTRLNENYEIISEQVSNKDQTSIVDTSTFKGKPYKDYHQIDVGTGSISSKLNHQTPPNSNIETYTKDVSDKQIEKDKVIETKNKEKQILIQDTKTSKNHTQKNTESKTEWGEELPSFEDIKDDDMIAFTVKDDKIVNRIESVITEKEEGLIIDRLIKEMEDDERPDNSHHNPREYSTKIPSLEDIGDDDMISLSIEDGVIVNKITEKPVLTPKPKGLKKKDITEYTLADDHAGLRAYYNVKDELYDFYDIPSDKLTKTETKLRDKYIKAKK